MLRDKNNRRFIVQ